MKNGNEMTLHEIIKALQETQGSNAKRAILEDNKENEDLRDYLKAVYDPSLNYFITEKTYPEVVGYSDGHDFTVNHIGEFIYQLSDRNKTGNAAKDWLKSVLRYFNNEQQYLIKLMLLKDIKAGISVSTINKVWPKLIFEQAYQRCSLPKDVKLNEWPWEKGIYSQVKMDGMYAAVSGTQVITRNGSVFPYDLLPEQFKIEMSKYIPEDTELNGELIVKRGGGEILSRKEGNGLLNSLLQGTSLPENYSLHYVAWDWQDDETVYSKRLSILDDLLGDGDFFSVVECRKVYSYEEAVQHFQAMLSQGQEGTVLKHPDGLWKDGTSKHQVKFKIEADVDLICTGIIEGTGKYEGMLGALQLQSACGRLKVDCGTGFTDKQRKELFECPPVGKVVEIKANDLLTKEGSDILSLFLPVFKCVRIDKDVADDVERIKSIFDSAKGIV